MDNQRWYALALKYLTGRPRSEKEVRDYLSKKKLSENQISDIISFLKEKRFLSDEDFTRWWIDQRTRFRPKGKLLITLELRQKGISSEVIDKIYREDTEDILTDEEKARSVIEKNKKYDRLPKPERYRKLVALLMRKGFDYSVIYRVLNHTENKQLY